VIAAISEDLSTRPRSSLDPHEGFILGLIDETPDITLAEIAECITRERRVQVAPSTVWMFLTKRDVTFKKDGACEQ
jgi:transposase